MPRVDPGLTLDEAVHVRLRSPCNCAGQYRTHEFCYHGPCTIEREFRDGSLLICNEAGYVRAVERREIGALG
jgi:hypothetical protein